jgi:hypothetical protein
MIEIHPETIAEPGSPVCEFGLCRREAKLELVLSHTARVQVCGMHVEVVLGWGVPEPLEPLAVRYLNTWHAADSAA